MDDLEFVQRCAKGDKQAWDEFVRKYSRLIYNYIYSVVTLRGSDRSISENINDIFQEIFFALTKNNFAKLKSFKGKNGSSLASWLRQVAVNATIDYLRRIRPAFSIDDQNEEGLSLKDRIADPSISVKDKVISEDTIEQLKDCIAKLETEDKYFLELYINQDVALEQLRILLKVSRGAIDMRKFRIIDRLRECFRSKGFELDL